METEAQALAVIAQHLQRIADALAAPKLSLGFGAAPKATQYVFCNRKHGGLWYTLNDQNQPLNIEASALTGYLHKIEFKTVERRGKEAKKLHCHIEADRTYILESAYDSNFSKGLLSAIAALSPQQLKQPITLVPQPSTENSEVLFCNVYQGEKQIFAPYDDQTDWRQCSIAAIEAVRLAHGQSAA